MHMSSRRIVVVAIVLVFGLGFATRAGAQGAYLGGAYSWATLSTEDVSVDLVKDNASAYKVFLGYEFPQFAGLEAGYIHFGSYDVAGNGAHEGTTGTLSSSGWTAGLTGRIPLGSILTIYGKVGYFWWDAEVKAAESIGDLAKSGNDLFYGAGLRLNIGKVSILGEYERFDSPELKNDLFSLGLRFSF
jgi:OmpA-OmpF porin, OOP family